MKTILFGKDGQVGNELRRTLLPFGELHCFGRKELDLTDSYALTEVLEQLAPDLIVNAAAYTAVDKAETDEATALQINASIVETMAAYAARTKALLIHYSTDYVFDGKSQRPYLESDITQPQSAYGRTKLAGEHAIAASGCDALVLRTSWVFSSHGGNFIKTMLRLGSERSSLNIVADQFGAPTSAELIADVTALAIAAFRQGTLASGLYHLSASGSTTWHGLASYAIKRALHNGMTMAVSPERIHEITTEQYPVPAKRPKNSRMDTSALSRALKLELPQWTTHVDRTVDALTHTLTQR